MAIRSDWVTILLDNGEIWSVGSQNNGRLGNGVSSNAGVATWVRESSNSVWTHLATGEGTVMAIRNDGTLWGWGTGGNYQIPQTTPTTANPTPLQEPSLSTNWTSVRCGIYNTFATKSDGTLWGCGVDTATYHRLGLASAANHPTMVQIGTDTDWDQSGVMAHNGLCGCALKTDGTFWGWGYDNLGGLGDYPFVGVKPEPVRIDHAGDMLLNNVKRIEMRQNGTLIVGKDGRLYGSGRTVACLQYFGSLHDYSVYSFHECGDGRTDWVDASLGGDINDTARAYCHAIRSDGTLWVRGTGGSLDAGGTLGDGTYGTHADFVQVGTDTDWAAITGGHYECYAIKTDGSLWGWGQNWVGELAISPIDSISRPTPVLMPTSAPVVSLMGFTVPVSAPAPDPDPVASASPTETLSRYFHLTLTGTADATTDFVLPVSNLNARLRSGSPSYLQCTLPYNSAYAAAIADRPNGDLTLECLTVDSRGQETLSPVTTVALESVQLSRGVVNSSIVLTGHRQSTNSAPASHTLSPLALQTGSNATVAILGGYNPSILPGDSVTTVDTTYTIGTVVLQASPKNVQTQLVEG